MTYEDLARTFDIMSSKNPTGEAKSWVGYDEWGFELSNVDLTPSDLRQLIAMGWELGCDAEKHCEKMAAWYNPSEHSDKELMELWENYKTIYQYE